MYSRTCLTEHTLYCLATTGEVNMQRTCEQNIRQVETLIFTTCIAKPKLGVIRPDHFRVPLISRIDSRVSVSLVSRSPACYCRLLLLLLQLLLQPTARVFDKSGVTASTPESRLCFAIDFEEGQLHSGWCCALNTMPCTLECAATCEATTTEHL